MVLISTGTSTTNGEVGIFLRNIQFGSTVVVIKVHHDISCVSTVTCNKYEFSTHVDCTNKRFWNSATCHSSKVCKYSIPG